MIAPALAIRLGEGNNPTSNTFFSELCDSLSGDLSDPFLRAIFAYLASNSWSDVLDEEALPLRDRLAIALRFLPDDEVSFACNKTLKSLSGIV